MIARAIRLLSALATLNLATLALGGDLNPPGAPAPTPGPEPRIAINDVNTPGNDSAHFCISEPGSYYLEDNFIILGILVKHGLVIEANDVTVDLNGFTWDGYTSTSLPHFNDSLAGILASGERENITVLNGIVRDWGEMGIDFETAQQSRVEGITVCDNLSAGMHCGGGSLITHCLAQRNGGSGIISANGSTIAECVALENSGSGITGGSQGCAIIACTSYENTSHGISVNFGCTVTQCTSARNTGDGIRLVNGANHALNNNCHQNGYETGVGAGIHSHSGGDRIEGNVVNNNDTGIEDFSNNSLIIRNSARNSTTAYDINGPHAVGPILTGTGTITSSNPWANFEF
jgi:hypothetical protein